MEVRQAGSDDIEAIVDELWLPFAREMAKLEDYNTLAPNVRADAIEHRTDKIAQDNYCAQLAVEDGEFVGFATGEVQPSSPVFERGATLAISEVYVRPDWRQQGIASTLVVALESWGDERGFETVSLSVNADNRAAKSLYETLGFQTKRHQMVKTPDE